MYILGFVVGRYNVNTVAACLQRYSADTPSMRTDLFAADNLLIILTTPAVLYSTIPTIEIKRSYCSNNSLRLFIHSLEYEQMMKWYNTKRIRSLLFEDILNTESRQSSKAISYDKAICFPIDGV